MTSSVQQVVLSGSFQCYLRTLFWQPESRHTSYWYFRLCETNPPVCVLHSPHIYTVHAHDEVCYLDQVSATQIEMSNHSSMSPGFKFVHATPHSSFFQARCVKLMRDLTPSQRFFNNFLSSLSFSLSLSFGAAAAAASALLRPSYHAEQTLYSSAPACSDWNFPAGTPGLLFFPPTRSSCRTQCHSCHGAKTGGQCGERAASFAHGVYCSWQRSVRSPSGGTPSFTHLFINLLMWKLLRVVEQRCGEWMWCSLRVEDWSFSRRNINLQSSSQDMWRIQWDLFWI